MKRKEILEKRLARLDSKKESLAQRCKVSEDANEVRSLTELLEDLNAEIEETRAELSAIEEEANANVSRETKVPADAEMRGAINLGSFKTAETRKETPLDSVEYRNAFMKYIQEGTMIPAEVRGNTTSTAETGVMVPLTIMNEVINTVKKRYGNLYSKVRKVSVKGGVEYPIGALKASFKWISETTVSPRQKMDKLGKVSFGYHVAEIRISQTFLSQLLTLSAFEATMTEVIAVAYLEAMDYAIMNGSGDGQPLGVLQDSRVTNTITMTAADISNWTKWRKNFFAKLPLGYRSGDFVFANSTVDAYLETMQDANGNPIFRQATGLEVNDGDAVNPNGRFFGREISLVEPDIIADFDSANAGDVIGLFWQPMEYAINENFAFTMRRYFDDETNEWVDKALVVVDGKALNTTGFYKIIKG